MCELVVKNARLKRIDTDLALENAAIKDVQTQKVLPPSTKLQVVEVVVTEYHLLITRDYGAEGLSQPAY